MERILERYERYSYSERQLGNTNVESQGSWSLEHAKLKARIEVLQRNQMHYMGEDLDKLSLRELQNLEHQLDVALKHIRSKKNQLMFESISELQKKDKALQDQNNMLAKKVKEKEKSVAAQQPQLEQQQNFDFNSSPFVLSQPLNSLNASETDQPAGDENEAEGTSLQPKNNGMMPSWMLQHIMDN